MLTDVRDRCEGLGIFNKEGRIKQTERPIAIEQK